MSAILKHVIVCAGLALAAIAGTAGDVYSGTYVEGNLLGVDTQTKATVELSAPRGPGVRVEIGGFVFVVPYPAIAQVYLTPTQDFKRFGKFEWLTVRYTNEGEVERAITVELPKQQAEQALEALRSRGVGRPSEREPQVANLPEPVRSPEASGLPEPAGIGSGVILQDVAPPSGAAPAQNVVPTPDAVPSHDEVPSQNVAPPSPETLAPQSAPESAPVKPPRVPMTAPPPAPWPTPTTPILSLQPPGLATPRVSSMPTLLTILKPSAALAGPVPVIGLPPPSLDAGLLANVPTSTAPRLPEPGGLEAHSTAIASMEVPNGAAKRVVTATSTGLVGSDAVDSLDPSTVTPKRVSKRVSKDADKHPKLVAKADKEKSTKKAERSKAETSKSEPKVETPEAKPAKADAWWGDSYWKTTRNPSPSTTPSAPTTDRK